MSTQNSLPDNESQASAIAKRTPEEIEQLEKLDSLMQGSGGASTDNVRIAAGFMKWALSGNAHLISPATAPPNIPLGCEFAFSKVQISNDTSKSEVYKTESGKLAIHKNGLEKIAKAAGVIWDMRQCGRTDDMKDSNFAAYRVVGHYRDLDGTVIPVFGEKQMDLRDGSERAKSMKPGDLSQQRKFIAEHAETKAKLRAIRSLGIKSGYTADELLIPFVVVKLAFNGRTSERDDPDRSLQKEYSLMIAQDMLGSKKLLGFEAGAAPELKDVTPGAETSETTAKPEEQPQQSQQTAEPEPKFCTAEMCYGDQSDGHIRACKGRTHGEVAEPAAWVIPTGRKAGAAINDPTVTNEDLSTLVGRYDFQLEEQGDLLPEVRQRLSSERKHVLDEVERRKPK